MHPSSNLEKRLWSVQSVYTLKKLFLSNFVNDQTGFEDARRGFRIRVRKGNRDVKAIEGRIRVRKSYLTYMGKFYPMKMEMTNPSTVLRFLSRE